MSGPGACATVQKIRRPLLKNGGADREQKMETGSREPQGDTRPPITYQLIIRIPVPLEIPAGRLGVCRFSPGIYVYTGSARSNLEARIRRHLGRRGRKHWHIDYLLGQPGVEILEVTRSVEPECRVNLRQQGTIPVPRFGACDCRAGCGSHLKRIAGTEWACCKKTKGDG